MQKIKQFLQRLGLGKKSDNQGFTLIEIVIVLAIAGLIFVIVFLAVSAAQASRRDTQRKNDANRFIAAVTQYAGNNAGALPTTQALTDTVRTTYAGNPVDPGTGTAYTITYGIAAPGAPGTMTYRDNAVCSTTTPGALQTPAPTARSYAVSVFLERGGATCQNGQ